MRSIKIAVYFFCFTGFFIFTLLEIALASGGEPYIKLTGDEQKWLDQKHTVRVRVGNWPPFMFAGENVKGVSIDYIEKIFDYHGIQHSIISGKDVPWKEALESIKKHQKVDLLPTAKITDKRKGFLAFSDEYLSMPMAIFTRTDSAFVGGINDLIGKTVSVQRGYVMHQLLVKKYPKINLLVFSDGDNLTEECIKALAIRKVDAYIGNLAVGSYLIQTKGYSNVKVAAPTPFENHNQAMAVRDDWPELASIITKTLKSFSPEEHAEIRNKWLSVRYEHGVRWIDVFKWVLVLASVLMTILGISIYWTRKLQKEILERKKFEEQLRESERQHRTLSEAAFEGITISKDNIISQANKAFTEMVDDGAKTVIGGPLLSFVSAEKRDEVLEKIKERYPLSFESIFLRKDGSFFPVEMQMKFYASNEHEYRITAIRDITQTKQAEAEIRILRGILPLCSHCKKVRDDQGYWNQIDAYLSEHSDTDISHSICPDCAEKYYPDMELYGDGSS